MEIEKIGRWAFVLGLVITILLGSVTFSYSTAFLVILGLIVGFFNISNKETSSFLIAVIALLVIGFAGLQVFLVSSNSFIFWLQDVFTNFITFVAAAGVVVAVKTIVKYEKQ